MSLLKKLFTFGRAVKSELEEEFTDAQAIRLLEQHIRDAKKAMEDAGRSRVDLAAKKKLSENRVAELKTEVAKYENFAMEALNKGNEALAGEVADKIATLEPQLSEEQGHLDNLNRDFSKIEGTIRKSKQQMSDLERQLAQVKATEAVQKAQERINTSSVSANAKVANAADSLKRLKAKQAERQAKLDAADELEGESDELSQKLKAAGIGGGSSSGNSVLERLKQKQNAG